MRKKSLFLIVYAILHNQTCWHNYRWCLKWCKLYRRSVSINRIIYLYTRNTVQIHNNINIFNIGLIKTKERRTGAGKKENGLRIER